MTTFGAPLQDPRAQSGFTLIEMLVATGMSIIVVFALTTILITTLHQTQRTFTEVDATQSARTTLATIDNELHSACVSAGGAPIQAGSTARTLDFVSYTGTAATTTPVWHELSLSGGTLTDTTYTATPANGGWTQGAKQGQTLLLDDAQPQPGVDPFQYFRYAAFTAPDGNQYWVVPNGQDALPTGQLPAASPESSSSGLSSDDAQNTVEVDINLLVGASKDNLTDPTIANTADAVTDAISLRLTTPPDEVAAGAGSGAYGPCQ